MQILENSEIIFSKRLSSYSLIKNRHLLPDSTEIAKCRPNYNEMIRKEAKELNARIRDTATVKRFLDGTLYKDFP